MKTAFKFDKGTGTMVPAIGEKSSTVKHEVDTGVMQTDAALDDKIPIFKKENRIEVKSEAVNLQDSQVVKMKRVDKPSSVMLVSDEGLPESYLDSISTGVMMFREIEDYDRCQIVDEKTGKVLAIIAGYALQMNFNMTELNSLDRIEQCLQGIVKLFRHKIMSQTFGSSDDAKK